MKNSISKSVVALIAAGITLIIVVLWFSHNIAWKVPIYFVAAFVVHYLEELFHCYRQAGDLASANHQLLDDVIWTRFLAIQIWLMVLLLIYCTMDELGRGLGRDRVRELFFGVAGMAAPQPQK